MSSDDTSHQLLALIQGIPAGANNDDLEKGLPDIPPAIRMEGLNKLLKQGSIEILKKGDKLFYRSKDPKKSVLPKDADNEEKIVYGIIEEGGNKGIWIRDIRIQSNLNMTQLNKILKNLETKKLIKAVKSVNASKKKVYMLYNLEPDRSVTGGAWYQDQDFEAEFVDVLNQQCLRFLQMKRDNALKKGEGPLAFKQLSCCTVKEVHKFISDLGISKVNLDEDDLETILKTVVYDGNAERILMSDSVYVYRAINSHTAPSGHQCPTCKNEIFPTSNLVSPVGDALKQQLVQANWGRNGLGLALLNEESVQNPKSVSSKTATNSSTPVSAATSSMTKIHHNNSNNSNQNNTLERSKANGAFANTTLKQDSPHSVLLMDAFNPPSNADIHASSRRPLLPRQSPIGGADRDENKYARRTPAEIFSRWSRRFYAPSSRPPWRRTWFLVLSGILAFVVLIYLMAAFGRGGSQESLEDAWNNPNPKPRHYE